MRRVGAGIGALALAQQPDAGRILREQERPVPALPRERAPGTTIDEPARPTLEPSATARFVLREWRFSGNAAIAAAELAPLVAEFIGREVGFEDLQEAAARITRHYRSRGYPVARAYLPAQTIEGGVVEIALLEGRYGRVSFENRSRVKDAVVRRHLDGLEGRTLTQPELERRMLLLNDLAGAGAARSSVRAGEKRGESDLAVTLGESPWASASVEFDNHGNRFTGQSRLTGEARLLSPLGLGDRLELRYTHGFEGLDYGRLAYQLPLGGDGWRIGAALSRSEYRLGKNFAPLAASGDADSASAQASYPLACSFGFNLYAQGTAERRDLRDRVASAGTVSDKRLDLAGPGLSGDITHAGGVTAFSLGGAYDVRGHPSGEATGDAGHVGTVELRHAIPVALGFVQPFAFVDAGRVTVNRNPFAAGANAASRSSAGLGLAWTKPGDFQVKFTWARRGSEAAASDTDRRSRAWLQLVRNF